MHRAREGEETFQVHHTREHLVVHSATVYHMVSCLVERVK